MGEAVASDVAKSFNSAAHPEVMAGRRNAEVRILLESGVFDRFNLKFCLGASGWSGGGRGVVGRGAEDVQEIFGGGASAPKASFRHAPQPKVVKRGSAEAKTTQSESCLILHPISSAYIHLTS